MFAASNIVGKRIARLISASFLVCNRLSGSDHVLAVYKAARRPGADAPNGPVALDDFPDLHVVGVPPKQTI